MTLVWAVTPRMLPQDLHPAPPRPSLPARMLRCGQPGVLEQDAVWSASPGVCGRRSGRSAEWVGGWMEGMWVGV